MRMLRDMAVAGVVSATMLLPTAAGAQTELIYNSYLPPINPAHQAGIAGFAARVAAESGGSIKVTIPDASLAPSDQQYSLLVDGVADLAWLPLHDMPQFVTVAAIAHLPYHAPTPRSAAIALWETYNEYLKDFNEFPAVKVLYFSALGGRQPMGLEAPITSPGDFEGKKIWVPRGPMTDIVEEMGAVPVHVNYPQLFEAVSRGLVDQLIASPGAVNVPGLADKINHYTVIPGGLGSVSFAAAISEESWNRLNEDEQAAILRAAEGMSEITGESFDYLEDHALEAMSHLQIAEPSDELMARLTPILDAQIEDWKERARAAGLSNPDEVIAFYRSVLHREISEH